MKKHLLIIIFLVLFVSCKGDKTHTENSIDISRPQVEKMSDLVDVSSVKIVKIESIDKSLINVISKVEICDDRIYIKDLGASNAILIFDINGNFISKPTKIGAGTDEFVAITDFQVDKINKKLIVLDMYKKSLSFYDLDGNFLEKKNIDLPAENFALLPNGGYVFFITPFEDVDGKRIVTTDKDFNIAARFYSEKLNKKFKISVPSRLTTNLQGDVLFSPVYSHTIYKVTQKDFEPYYRLNYNFGTPLPNDISLELTPSNQKKILNDGGFVYTPGSFVDNGKCWCISINDGYGFDNEFMIFAVKPTNRSKSVYKYNEGDAGEMFTSVIGGGNDGYFISKLNPSLVSKIKWDNINLPQESIDVLKSISPDDNPIIVLYKLKEF